MNRDDDMTGNEDQRHAWRVEDHDAAQRMAHRRRKVKQQLTDPCKKHFRMAEELEERQKQLKAKAEELKQWK